MSKEQVSYEDLSSSYGESSSTINKTVTRVVTDNEYVILGTQKFYTHELMSVFGGVLNLGITPPAAHRIGNPAPVGLFTFGLTCFIMSLYGAHAGNIMIPNVIVGMVIFVGGTGQVICGIGEMIIGNTFGATAMLSFACFWFSYAAILIPSFGIEAAYAEHMDQFENAVGFLMMGYAILAIGLTTLTLKAAVSLVVLFVCISMTFLLSSIGAMTLNANVTLAGNIFGVLTGVAGMYNGLAEISFKENSYFSVPVGPLSSHH
ncbi:Ammonia transport outward protein 2 [Spathaspora sp. JA1]|nr:Ammonia transport outward protein 2 [Spathaspora sp. JA1]